SAVLCPRRMSNFEKPNVKPSLRSISVTRKSSDPDSRVASSRPPNPAPRMRTFFMSVDAELVAFGILHHHEVAPEVFDALDLLRAEPDEARRLGVVGSAVARRPGADVEMHAVLRRLRFGHLLEEHARLDAVRVADDHP